MQGLLSPIAENQEEKDEIANGAFEQPEAVNHTSTRLNSCTLDTSERPSFAGTMSGGRRLPATSLPEIPAAVSPHPVSPRDKARENWLRGVEVCVCVCACVCECVCVISCMRMSIHVIVNFKQTYMQLCCVSIVCAYACIPKPTVVYTTCVFVAVSTIYPASFPSTADDDE